MSWRDSPSIPETKSYTAAGTIDIWDIIRYGNFVVAPSSAAITITLDSPDEHVRGWNFFVTNDNSTYNVVLSCTNGFVQDGDSVTIQPGDTLWIHCNEDADGDLRWFVNVPTSDEVIQDVAGAMFTGNTETGIAATYQDGDGTVDLVVDTEWVQDLVGAMFTSNTETGATIAYQDGDGTIDFTLDLDYVGDQVAGMFTGGSHTLIAFTYNDDSPGTVDAVVDEETIQDNIAAMFTGASHTGISATYNDATPDIELAMDYPTEWSDYTPTISWTDAAPASVTTVARYMQTGPNSVRVKVYFTSSDGDGKTPDSITLPAITGKQVADIDALVAVNAVEYIDTAAAGGASVIAAWLDQEDDTEGNRIITLDGSSAWTDTKDCWVSVSAEYEIEDSA